MASTAQWVEGARPRTLPAAIAPVAAGAGVAAAASSFDLVLTVLCLAVSLALQIGVNYANDYSDGIRGTDDHRVGPFRLVGSGTARPSSVKGAAFACFGLGALAGLVVVAVSGHWWLVLVGAAAIAAAWFYTGGSKPYGYRGLGEVMVFVFFGLVAVAGTAYVQIGSFTWPALAAAVAIGALACSLLVANNVRDIPTDGVAGKRTLAVRLGDTRSRQLYGGLLAVAYLLAILLAVTGMPRCLLTLLSLPLAARAIRPVLSGATGRDLIPVLRDTGLLELAFALLLMAGLALR